MATNLTPPKQNGMDQPERGYPGVIPFDAVDPGLPWGIDFTSVLLVFLK